MSPDYAAFLDAKTHSAGGNGFEPVWVPDFLHDFQRVPVEWWVRRGRGAIYADCGLGKTPMQLVCLENVVRKTNRPALLVTTLGDSAQTIREAAKFGVEAHRSRDGSHPGRPLVVVTNYERLDRFDPADFAAVAANESGCIKDFDSARSGAVIDFMRKIPHRLLCTATAAPNDHMEFGVSSEALGGLGYMDMLARFFRSDNGTLHPYRTHSGGRPKQGAKWEFRPHAEPHFWRWVCSWARAFRKPSDLGFADGPFVLPPHEVTEHAVAAEPAAPGRLFPVPAVTMREQRAEQRRTLEARCELAARLVADAVSAVCWCHLNPEGDLLARLIPGAEQVSGRTPDERKEELFDAFAAGQVRVLVTKPTVAGFGLNWQHCATQTYFPSHSFEQYYQAVRRLWRHGQTRPVRTRLVTTAGGSRVAENLNRKADQADRQYAQIVARMADPLGVGRGGHGDTPVRTPAWL